MCYHFATFQHSLRHRWANQWPRWLQWALACTSESQQQLLQVRRKHNGLLVKVVTTCVGLMASYGFSLCWTCFSTGAPLSKRNAGVSVLGCAIAMVAVGGCAQVGVMGQDGRCKIPGPRCFPFSTQSFYYDLWSILHFSVVRFLNVWKDWASGHRPALRSTGCWHGTQSIHEGRSFHVRREAAALSGPPFTCHWCHNKWATTHALIVPTQHQGHMNGNAVGEQKSCTSFRMGSSKPSHSPLNIVGYKRCRKKFNANNPAPTTIPNQHWNWGYLGLHFFVFLVPVTGWRYTLIGMGFLEFLAIVVILIAGTWCLAVTWVQPATICNNLQHWLPSAVCRPAALLRMKRPFDGPLWKLHQSWQRSLDGLFSNVFHLLVLLDAAGNLSENHRKSSKSTWSASVRF